MIRSMTAFARCERPTEHGTLTVELRSVNARYLDLSLRLPEELRTIEMALRDRLNGRLTRGKVDLTLRLGTGPTSRELEIDRTLVGRLAERLRELDELLFDTTPVDPLEVLRWPGVVVQPALDAERLQSAALEAVDAAIDELEQVRGGEGERLAALLQERCEQVAQRVAEVRRLRPAVVARLSERWRSRLEGLGLEGDPQRLEQELALAAQKLDVDEELDRLDSHLVEMAEILSKGGAVGRRLDFLMQEFNREANTLASKSADGETTRHAVELKVLIEQMREQIQNIE